jgi:hypothetical protein
MSEGEESQNIVFSITDQKLDDMFNDRFGDRIDFEGQYYSLNQEDFEDFQDFAENNGFDTNQDIEIGSGTGHSDYFNRRSGSSTGDSDYFNRRSMGEISVTGGGEAYLPGLDVPEKKYKGPKENEIHDGYKKVNGFRPGHTKDKGGFQYSDLWDVNEGEENEKFGFSIGEKVKVDVNKPKNASGVITGFEGDNVFINVTGGGNSTYDRPMVFHNSKVKKMEDNLQEGIKTEIKVRNSHQQFQEAVKLANKRLREVNSILEYASQLKTSINEDGTEVGNHKIMEKLKKNVVSAYGKLKNL